MILAIAKKEVRDALRDGRLRWAASVVGALLVVSIALAAQQVQRTRDERTAAAAIERENWLEQGEKNPHAASHYGAYVFKTPSPLALFDRGLEPFVGSTFYLEAHGQSPATHLPAQDATALRRFGALSASTGMQVLVPLLVVLLAFGAFAGERERGTLRQVSSLGVRPRDLLLGKALGLGAVVAVLVLPVGLVTALALSWIPSEGDGWWTRLALLGAANGLYLAALLGFSLFVSAAAPSSRSALAVLLAAWAANAILVPRLATDLVQHFLPTPLLADFEQGLHQELSGGIDGHDPRNQRLQELALSTLREHGVQRLEDLPFNFNGLAMLESERMSDEIHDRHYARLWDRLGAQDLAVTLSGIAAPMLALRSASMALCGSDLFHHRHFSVAAEEHRRHFVRLLNEDMMKNSRYDDHGYTVGRSHWEKLPPFAYVAPSAAEAFAAALPGLTVLLAWAAGAWLLLLGLAPRLLANVS